MMIQSATAWVMLLILVISVPIGLNTAHIPWERIMISDSEKHYQAIRHTYKAVAATAMTTPQIAASMVRGLGDECDLGQLAAVAEVEAVQALLRLRNETGISLTVQEWIDGPFQIVDDYCMLGREELSALVRRVANAAGGLWEAPTLEIASMDRREVAVSYFLMLLCCVIAIAEIAETSHAKVLAQMFQHTDTLVVEAGSEAQ